MGSDLLPPLLTSLLAADQRAAQRVVDDALARGCSTDDVRFRLITPALHAVGDRWERGEIGVADEHLATSVCEWLLIRMAGRTRRAPASGRRALVGCSEGELHALGVRMVAGVLVESGWSVLYLGAATPSGAWGPIVRARHPDLAVVGTTMPDALPAVETTLRAIKAARPECLTAIGGQAYDIRPEVAEQLGADIVARNARDLVAQLEARYDG
jgi:methanogenic corrinoid protein MtbC1